MAGDLKKNAEFGGKHKDTEDPILTAQRYLNIYRQIHIFNETRQEEFDESLLAMPADIRILLSTLPGGSLLLNHMAELEEKKGITTASIKDSVKSKNAKKASPKRLDDYKRSATLDGASASVLDIIEQNETRHQQDIQALTDALVQSQNNMASVLKDIFQNKSAAKIAKDADEQDEDDAQDIEDIEDIEDIDDIEDENDDVKHVKKSKSSESEPESKPAKKSKSSESEPESKPAKKSKKKKAEAPVEEDYEEENEDDTKEPEETPDNSEASKLMSLTRRLFHSIKERRNNRAMLENDESVDAFGDNTPVSLDDVDNNPVSLDNEAVNDLTSQNTEPAEGDDWDWEYVEDDASDGDGEWEYIEIPEDEAQPEDNEPEPESIEPQEQTEAESAVSPEEISSAGDDTADIAQAETAFMPDAVSDDLTAYDAQGFEQMPQEWTDANGDQTIYYPQDSEMLYDGQYSEDPQNQMWYDNTAGDENLQLTDDQTYGDDVNLAEDNASYDQTVDTSLMPESEAAPSTAEEEQTDGVESSASLLKRFMATEVSDEQSDSISELDTPMAFDTAEDSTSEESTQTPSVDDLSTEDASQNETDAHKD